MYLFCLGKKRAHYLDKKSGLAYWWWLHNKKLAGNWLRIIRIW
jgi:hypothetical protein